MSSLFHVIEDASVILRTKRGVYKQAKVYRRADAVYANYSGGFVRLLCGSGTTCPDVLWSDLDAHGVLIPRIGNPRMAPAVAMAA